MPAAAGINLLFMITLGTLITWLTILRLVLLTVVVDSFLPWLPLCEADATCRCRNG